MLTGIILETLHWVQDRDVLRCRVSSFQTLPTIALNSISFYGRVVSSSRPRNIIHDHQSGRQGREIVATSLRRVDYRSYQAFGSGG